MFGAVWPWYIVQVLSLIKRFLSADYRAALAAEAAGQLEQAAEHYALAGERGEAARVHIARSERATSLADRIAALRDALHWAEDGTPLRRRILKHLGRALMEQLEAEGVATPRDKQRVRAAAEMLIQGADYARAGEALESIGATQEAIAAYSKGGLVERMEQALQKDEELLGQERALRQAFANYQMHMRIGERDAARSDLRMCLEAADKKSEYRRLLDELESRLITGGVVSLRKRQGAIVTVACAPVIVMGRDSLCELSLRAGGISRRHADITVAGPDEHPRFHLRDLGSKNGTLVAGLPIEGSVPLIDRGRFSLGEHCDIEYQVTGTPPHLILRVQSGMDQGRVLVAGGPGELMDLMEHADIPVSLVFEDGRPLITRRDDGARLLLREENVARGSVQLVHGDQLRVDQDELEVL